MCFSAIHNVVSIPVCCFRARCLEILNSTHLREKEKGFFFFLFFFRKQHTDGSVSCKGNPPPPGAVYVREIRHRRELNYFIINYQELQI